MLNIFLSVLREQWKITIVVLLLLPVLINLGFWQLDRAEEKKQLLAFYEKQSALAPIPLINLISNSQAKYQNVTVTGKYDTDHYWLLDNQPRGGKVGYEIIMPFKFTDSSGNTKTLLINRGWVSADADRRVLPIINTPENSVSIEGYLYPLQVNAVIKHSQNDLKVEWPKRVLQLDNEAASKALSEIVEPLMLRIDEESTGAFITQWPVINTQPEKHHGYAVQWFSMGFALLLLYLWVLFRTKKQ